MDFLQETISKKAIFNTFKDLFKGTQYENNELPIIDKTINYVIDWVNDLLLKYKLNKITFEMFPKIYIEKFFSFLKRFDSEKREKFFDKVSKNNTDIDYEIEVFLYGISFIIILKKLNWNEEADQLSAAFNRIRNLNDLTGFNDVLTDVMDSVDDHYFSKELTKLNQIYENEHIRVFRMDNFNDCLRLGKATKWCVASKKNGEKFFYYYKFLGDLYVFVLKGVKDKKDREVKYLLTAFNINTVRNMREMFDIILYENVSKSNLPYKDFRLSFDEVISNQWKNLKSLKDEHQNLFNEIVSVSPDSFKIKSKILDKKKQEEFCSIINELNLGKYITPILDNFFDEFKDELNDDSKKDLESLTNSILRNYFEKVRVPNIVKFNLNTALAVAFYSLFLESNNKNLANLLIELQPLLQQLNLYSKERFFRDDLFSEINFKIPSFNLHATMKVFKELFYKNVTYYMADSADNQFIVPDFKTGDQFGSYMKNDHLEYIKTWPKFEEIKKQINNVYNYYMDVDYNMNTIDFNNLLNNLEALFYDEEEKKIFRIFRLLVKYNEISDVVFDELRPDKIMDLQDFIGYFESNEGLLRNFIDNFIEKNVKNKGYNFDKGEVLKLLSENFPEVSIFIDYIYFYIFYKVLISL